ncbi:MAG: GNAT family N-acetyltransferase [Actinomycetota bacterium]|nr:GNAT family N-acetyltransferase [Actinomycetota bacterium]
MEDDEQGDRPSTSFCREDEPKDVNIIGEMKYFLGEGKYAQFKFAESGTAFSIDIVLVPTDYRGQGIGTFLIKHVLYLADAMKKSVFLSARPIGKMGEDELNRLIDYYTRFGFEVEDRGLTVVYMHRKAPEH